MSEAGEERRLTTILAADVVGYSRLMAADEAGTLTSLNMDSNSFHRFRPRAASLMNALVKENEAMQRGEGSSVPVEPSKRVH